MIDLVLVDGPNLFGTVGRYLERTVSAELAPSLKDYLFNWFDFDRFVLHTLGSLAIRNLNDSTPKLGIVLVHSNKHLGKDKHRIENPQSSVFWGRQASRAGTSSLVVDIPGDQQETYPFPCSGCGVDNQARSASEKGVDSTMIVYMFETSQSWESACLFSRDADFVPAVWALRRRGKQVMVAAEPQDAATALGRAAQSFLPLPFEFLDKDLGAYEFLRVDGLLDRWLRGVESQYGVGIISTGPRELQVVLKGSSDPCIPLLLHLRDNVSRLPGMAWLTEREPTKNPAAFVFNFTAHLDRVPGSPHWRRCQVPDFARVPEPKEARSDG